LLKDVKSVFDWARENGDANIYDRILVKVMPALLSKDLKLTAESIQNATSIEVSKEIYDLIVQAAENLVGAKYV